MGEKQTHGSLNLNHKAMIKCADRRLLYGVPSSSGCRCETVGLWTERACAPYTVRASYRPARASDHRHKRRHKHRRCGSQQGRPE